MYMMNTAWLKNKSVSNTENNSTFLQNVDEDIAFNAFIQHWHQVSAVLNKEIKNHQSDDVTIILNHFGKMINLLLTDLHHMIQDTSKDLSSTSNLESHFMCKNGSLKCKSSHQTPIFDQFVGERVLQIIVQWALKLPPDIFFIIQLEFLKIYEVIINNSHPEILIYKPITEPLIILLETCIGHIGSEVEKRLIVLLNQLWVSIVNNPQLLKYFYQPNQQPQKFLIFSLLLPYIHREGTIGQQTRDTLLLCLSLASKHENVAQYIKKYSNFCPIVAAGLSGLYSMLPRKLNITTEGWCQLSSNDVANSDSLRLFLSLLGFCDAIVQISGTGVHKQFVDYFYQGFLIPVVGPAIVQVTVPEEMITSIIYLDFFIRSVSQNELIHAFLSLLLCPQQYSDVPILSLVISYVRKNNVQLTLVCLNLLQTLIELHSEDAMVALVFQYLTPCTHVMLSQRSKLSQPPFQAAQRFLSLMPSVCQVKKREISKYPSVNRRSCEGSTNEESKAQKISPTPFSIYLREASEMIKNSRHACSDWCWSYDAQNPLPSEAILMIEASKLAPLTSYYRSSFEDNVGPTSLPYENAVVSESVKLRSLSLPTNYNSKKTKQSYSRMIKTRLNNTHKNKLNNHNITKFFKSNTMNTESEQRLESLGETTSSGYESFNFKPSPFSSPLHGTDKSEIDAQTNSQSEGTDAHAISQFNEKSDAQREEIVAQRNSQKEEISKILSQENEILNPCDEILDLPDSLQYFDPMETQNNRVECDDSFIAFLDESCEISTETTHESSDFTQESTYESNDLEFIENFYDKVADRNQSRRLPNEDYDCDLQSLWLPQNSSIESADEMNVFSQSKATIGPLIESLISHVSNMLNGNIHVTLLVINCLSSLACFPCPILTTLILQPSVVLQPAVRSLYQALSQLKQKLDAILTVEDYSFLGVVRAHLQQSCSNCTKSSAFSNSFSRGADKRRSFSQTLTGFFKRSNERYSVRKLQNLPDGSGYRYINNDKTEEAVHHDLLHKVPNKKRKAILCAVIMQEWLLQLAALAEEHTVSILPYNFTSLTAPPLTDLLQDCKKLSLN